MAKTKQNKNAEEVLNAPTKPEVLDVVDTIEAEPGVEVNPEASQHPSVEGADAGVEVAKRTADTDKHSSDEYVRVFVLGPGGVWDAKSYDHGPNRGVVIHDALALGLRPTGDVRFVGKKTHRDGKSRVLTYAVDAIPTVLVDE